MSVVFLRVFYTVTSFKEASGDIGFPVLAAIALHRSVFSYLSLISMHLRPRGSVRMRRSEMMDEALCQSAGRLERR